MAANFALRVRRIPISTSTRTGTSKGDRRQGQRAGGGAGRADAAVVEAASTSRSGPTPIRTSGSRGGTGSMPGIWEAMRDSRTPCSVLTKSPLLLRDVELFKQIHEVAGFAAQPLDPDARGEGVARERAAHAAPAQADRGGRRAEQGGHTDGRPDRAADAGHQRRPEQVEGILELRRRRGRASNRRHRAAPARRGARHLLRLAASYRPDLVPRYEELYARGAYVGSAERERIQGLLRQRGDRPGGGTRAMRRTVLTS